MAPQPGLEPGANAELITAQSVALPTELLRNNIFTSFIMEESNALKVAPQPGLEPGANADFITAQSVALPTEVLKVYQIPDEKKPAKKQVSLMWLLNLDLNQGQTD